ncbi:serine protease [Amycolatopsis suaedae]|uniref:Serine protease n=1 Tax=Amycolatopsis suaedae TaxID=2510978 RepID=A0A4Q7IZJ9_9PSEU|nr:serine protease [Amycolatopsis suaedae]
MLRRASTVVACATLVLAGQQPASASAERDCVSTRSTRYLVVFDRGTSADDADTLVEAACGRTTAYYPQIAVGVATSADPDFGERVRPAAAFSAQAHRRTSKSVPLPGGRQRIRADDHTVPAADRHAEQWNLRMIHADAPWTAAGRDKVVVGVLDSGIDPAHPDLAGAVDAEQSAGCLTGAPETSPKAWRPTTSPHGTHVAGTIAAADDGRGVTGVAPGVRVASIKVVDDRGRIDPEAAVCGLMWAADNDMAVTNSSFAVDTGEPACSGEDRTAVVEAVSRAVAYAGARGTLNVAAATNDAAGLSPVTKAGPRTRCATVPASLREVVTVSATTDDGTKAGYSSYGLGVVDLAAPGGAGGDCVLSTVPGGYAPLCGTSMAAPHVAGVAARLAAEHPGWSARQLRATLQSRARPLACPDDYDLTGDGTQDAFCAGYEAYNGFYGHGMVSATP